jgi:hypothetical protein
MIPRSDLKPAFDFDDAAMKAIATVAARTSMHVLTALVALIAAPDAAKKTLAALEDIEHRRAQLLVDKKAFEEDCERVLAGIAADRKRLAYRLAEIADERNHPALAQNFNEARAKIAAREASAN